MIAVGDAAPDFTLPAPDGSSITLSQYRGKYVVLYFYPKANSLGCTIETREFQRTLPEFASKNMVVLGISVDPVGEQQRFAQRCALDFPLLADGGGGAQEILIVVRSPGVRSLRPRPGSACATAREEPASYDRDLPARLSRCSRQGQLRRPRFGRPTERGTQVPAMTQGGSGPMGSIWSDRYRSTCRSSTSTPSPGPSGISK